MLQVNHLSLHLEDAEILRDVSFCCEKGDVLTIVGPNGCGKSTTLKIISRILDPGSGEVLLLGRNIRD